MKRTRLAMLAALLPDWLLVGSASAATAANGMRPAAVLAGSLGRLPGTSPLIVVQVGVPHGATKSGHSPASYHYLAVAEQQVTSGDFRVAVPESATLRRAAHLGHLSMRWNYYSTSDTTLSVGISVSGSKGPWSADGSFTTSNSLGTGSGFTASRETRIYSDGNM